MEEQGVVDTLSHARKKGEGKGAYQPLKDSKAILRDTMLQHLKSSETAEQQRPSDQATRGTRVERRPICHGSRTRRHAWGPHRVTASFLDPLVKSSRETEAAHQPFHQFLTSSSSSDVPRSKPSPAQPKRN